MDFVDEKHIARIQPREQARQVSRFVEHRSRCNAQLSAHFVGDDVRECGFAQSRGAVEQYMVERIAAH